MCAAERHVPEERAGGCGTWAAAAAAAAARFHHLFDGYATLVRVSFRQGRATGAHRQIESDAYVSAVARGAPVLREFSQCPKPGNMLEIGRAHV